MAMMLGCPCSSRSMTTAGGIFCMMVSYCLHSLLKLIISADAGLDLYEIVQSGSPGNITLI
jgi:hypothetical protein